MERKKGKIFRNNSKLFYKINFQKYNIKYTKTLIFMKKLSVMQKINMYNNVNNRICSAEISRQATTSNVFIFLFLLRMFFFNIYLKKDVHRSFFVNKNIICQSNFNDGPFNFGRLFMYAT